MIFKIAKKSTVFICLNLKDLRTLKVQILKEEKQ